VNKTEEVDELSFKCCYMYIDRLSCLRPGDRAIQLAMMSGHATTLRKGERIGKMTGLSWWKRA